MPDKDLQTTIRDTEQDIRQNNNPDILTCIANLSNDEVFTPPNIANKVLDLLPNELWTDPKVAFLDPCSKTGVFLREIVKRLDKGLKEKIPDDQDRVNHILQNQVFGIAITDLTALISRRTVYCSKTANGTHSIATCFDTEQGNIKFDGIDHTWNKQGKCHYCGASKAQFKRGGDLETHAYHFIHTDTPETLFTDEQGKAMKFDVIIGNPPYQISDGGAQASAKPIYHHFIQQAKKLNPRYLSMIVPARWYTGGKGLDDFRKEMLNDDCLRILVDYPNASDCFDGVTVEGGICYFLWDRDNRGDCTVKTMIGDTVHSETTRPLLEKGMDTFIRHNNAISIIKKIQQKQLDSAGGGYLAKQNLWFDSLVSSQKPFGLRTFFRGKPKQSKSNSIKIYTTKSVGYVKMDDVPQNQHWVHKYKVYIPMAYGAGGTIPHSILGQPILGHKNTCCSETYLVIGPFDDGQTAENIQHYITTKFLRFCVSILKNTQHASQKVYKLAPVMDFSKTWTDSDLYTYFNLTPDEIAYIESMIKPMVLERG